MGTISEKYKRDLLSYIRSIMFWSTFAFTMTPLRRQNFFPYYLGIVSACMIAALVVVVWKCTHGAAKEPFTWIGGLLPIVFGATVTICWCLGNKVETDWWGVKLLMVVLFVPLSLVLQKCQDEDVRDSANMCIVYILMCMSFTQL